MVEINLPQGYTSREMPEGITIARQGLQPVLDRAVNRLGLYDRDYLIVCLQSRVVDVVRVHPSEGEGTISSATTYHALITSTPKNADEMVSRVEADIYVKKREHPRDQSCSGMAVFPKENNELMDVFLDEAKSQAANSKLDDFVRRR